MAAADRRGRTVRTLRIVLTAFMTLVVLASLAAAAAGVWFVRELGTSGSAVFTGRTDPGTVLVVGPDVLARNQTPVTVRVTAREPGEQLWVGLARPGDANAALGDTRRTVATGVTLDDWRVETASRGSETAQGITTGDIWTSTAGGRGELEVTVARQAGAQTLVVTGADGTPADLESVTLTWSRGTWFVQALAVTIVGVLVAALVGLALVRRARRAWRTRRDGTAEAPATVDEGDAPRRSGNDDETIVLALDREKPGPDRDDADDSTDSTETPDETTDETPRTTP